MHLRQRQRRTEEDESPHLAAPRLQVFDTVGKPLTTSFDAGVPLRDVQEAASHADPRTTMRYDRARATLDRHATYIVAAYIAGAARYDSHNAFAWPSGHRPGEGPGQDRPPGVNVHSRPRAAVLARVPATRRG
jgi:hypothetical protein